MTQNLVVTEYITLDGSFHEPGEWSFPFWNEQAMEFKKAELFSVESMLLGRKTYEGFAAAWPTMDDEEGFADRMNGMPKYVVSSTLSDPSWTNTRVIGTGDIAGSVADLKASAGGPILVAGSGQLVRALLAANLIDELRFLLHPFVIGTGQKLFTDGLPQGAWTLTDLQKFDTGVVALTYQPA